MSNSKLYSWIGAMIGGISGLAMAKMLDLSWMNVLNWMIIGGGLGFILSLIYKPRWLVIVIGMINGASAYTIGPLKYYGGISMMILYSLFGFIVLGYSGLSHKKDIYLRDIAFIVGYFILSIILGLIIYTPFTKIPIFLIAVLAFIGYILGNPLGDWIENNIQRQRLERQQLAMEKRREQERIGQEGRKAEEKRRRREEEERRRLREMKQNILDKIDEITKGKF